MDHDPLHLNKHPAGGNECCGRLIILRVASLAAAAPSQQQLRRSSSSVAATYNLALKSQMVVIVASLLEVLQLRSSWQHLEEGHELLLLRSISSVAAAATAGDGRVPR
tara:strand:- start:76 stop:399 length:324 start_codon:yes stop_codon:yes gene_type:complete